MRTNVTYAKLDLYIQNEPSTVSRVQMTPEIHNEKTTTCIYSKTEKGTPLNIV